LISPIVNSPVYQAFKDSLFENAKLEKLARDEMLIESEAIAANPD
jgi:hypothetical protein